MNQNNVDLEDADIVKQEDPEVINEQSVFFLDNNFNTTKTQESFDDNII